MVNIKSLMESVKGNKTKIGIMGILLTKALIAVGVSVPVWIIPVLIVWTGPSAIGHVDRWIDKIKNSG